MYTHIRMFVCVKHLYQQFTAKNSLQKQMGGFMAEAAKPLCLPGKR